MKHASITNLYNMSPTANSIPAALAVFRTVAAAAGTPLDALPKKPTLAQLSRWFAAGSNRAAYSVFMELEGVTPAFKDKIRNRVGMYKIGLDALPDLIRQLPAIVRDMDDLELQLLAYEVLRALPGASSMENVSAGVDIPVHAPLTEEQLVAALSQLHGAILVKDVRDDVLRHAGPALVANGRVWDMVWAMYARAAAKHLPHITMRPINTESAVALQDLGGAREFVAADDAAADAADELARLAM